MTDNLENAKNEIRARIRSERERLDEEWIESTSGHIQDSILKMDAFREARVVSSYMALPPEVQTSMLIKDCWGRNVRVCAPCFNEQTNAYAWAWLAPGEKTELGHWHVPELRNINWLGAVEPELIIVPAMALDRNGGRLGHGGGHYDHLLKDSHALKIAPAFDFQIVDNVPMGPADIPVDIIVTETQIYDLR